MSRHEQAGVLWLGLGIFLWSLVIGPPRGGQFLDLANASGGGITKLDRAGAFILGCRGKLARGSRGAVVGISLDVAGR